MEYYQEIIKKMERPEKYISILGVAVATVAATLIVKKAITKRNGFSEGTEIPSPKGDYFYLGKVTIFTVNFVD